MRIIAGRLRRTPIPVIAAPGLRPTPDRVRETVFNWLEHLLPGWAQVRVLDMFAGTGVLGWECASRGAREVTLVERQARAAQALRQLQERLQCPGVDIVQGDALAVAARMPPASLDVVFVDPPFDSGLLPAAVAAASRLLRREGLVYVESAHALDSALLESLGLERVRAGQAGAVRFHLLRARSC